MESEDELEIELLRNAQAHPRDHHMRVKAMKSLIPSHW